MDKAKTYKVPIATLTWLSEVPFVVDPGQQWSLFASDIWGTISSDTSSKLAQHLTYDNVCYIPEVGGIICRPYYLFKDTLKTDFEGSDVWLEFQECKIKMLQYPLSEARKGEKSPTLTANFEDGINRSFCIVFRHRKSPPEISINKPAQIQIAFGDKTAHPITIQYIDGTGYFKVFNANNVDFNTGLRENTIIPITTVTKAGKGTLVFNEDCIALTVLCIGNNVVIGNGLLGEGDSYSGTTIVRERPEDDGQINKKTLNATTGQVMTFIRDKVYDGGLGQGVSTSLRYDVNPITITCAYAQFELAWIPIEFQTGGSFTFTNTGIPPILNTPVNPLTRGVPAPPATPKHSVNELTQTSPNNKDIDDPLVSHYKYIQRYCHIPSSWTTNAKIEDEVVSIVPIPSPDPKDLSLATEGQNYYKCTLTPGNTIGPIIGNTRSRTPIWYGIKGYTEPTVISLKVPKMAETHVYSIDGTETPDSKEYSVTLRNRDARGVRGGLGEGNWSKLQGCYPLTLSFGWKFADGKKDETLHFTGFVREITYNRDSKLSTVTLKLVDKKQVCLDMWASNLPIYDGWYDTEVIEDLAARCGVSVITKNVEKVRISRGNFHNVLWMFPEGEKIWNCMSKICEYRGHSWLYFDANGVLNYEHLSKVIQAKKIKAASDPIYQFSEVSHVNNYNELKTLTYNKNFDNTYNRVYVRGVTPFLSNKWNILSYMLPGTPEEFQKSMDLSVSSIEGWIPWNKTLVQQETSLNTQGAVNNLCEQVFNTYRRPGYTIAWSTWGQPKLFPLDIIQVYEDVNDGGSLTIGGANDSQTFYTIITGITHSLNAQEGTYDSMINADRIPDGPGGRGYNLGFNVA